MLAVGRPIASTNQSSHMPQDCPTLNRLIKAFCSSLLLTRTSSRTLASEKKRNPTASCAPSVRSSSFLHDFFCFGLYSALLDTGLYSMLHRCLFCSMFRIHIMYLRWALGRLGALCNRPCCACRGPALGGVGVAQFSFLGDWHYYRIEHH